MFRHIKLPKLRRRSFSFIKLEIFPFSALFFTLLAGFCASSNTIVTYFSCSNRQSALFGLSERVTRPSSPPRPSRWQLLFPSTRSSRLVSLYAFAKHACLSVSDSFDASQVARKRRMKNSQIKSWAKTERPAVLPPPKPAAKA